MKPIILAASLSAALMWNTRASGAPAVKARVSHQVWVEQSFREMSTIKVGMTRQKLMKVFTWPGGLWAVSRTKQTFAYRDCPSFLVDVEFKPVGALKKGTRESPRDLIIKISRPYLAQVYYN